MAEPAAEPVYYPRAIVCWNCDTRYAEGRVLHHREGERLVCEPCAQVLQACGLLLPFPDEEAR